MPFGTTVPAMFVQVHEEISRYETQRIQRKPQPGDRFARSRRQFRYTERFGDRLNGLGTARLGVREEFASFLLVTFD